MNCVPKASIKSLTVGDILAGQDGNKYIVCKKGKILYWEPYDIEVSGAPSFSPEYYPLYEPTEGTDGRMYRAEFVDDEKEWVLVPSPPSFSPEYYPLYEPTEGYDGRMYWVEFVDDEKKWVLMPNQ